MKRIIFAAVMLAYVSQAHASEVIPPRIVVERLVKAVQEGKDQLVSSYFKFDKQKHGKLTPLSRAEQIALLKDIPLDRMVFDKDKYAVDEGRRFVVRLVAPKKLDFEIEYVELKGDPGPPWKYDILAIRATAPPPRGGDGKPSGRG